MSLRNASSELLSSKSSSVSSSGNAALVAKIQEKQKELENLAQLCDLSTNLTHQIVLLESKLGTLADGTEGVAKVLLNWQNVFQAINLATSRMQTPAAEDQTSKEEAEQNTADQKAERLVRIPASK